MKQIKKTKRPVVSTPQGNAVEVVQDVQAYQRLPDIAAHGDFEEGVRQGMEDAKRGRVLPAREVFADFEKSRGLLR